MKAYDPRQDDFYAQPLLLSWANLGGTPALEYDGARDVWIAHFPDGLELRAAGRDIQFVGQEVRAYFHHERFLRQLRPVADA